MDLWEMVIDLCAFRLLTDIPGIEIFTLTAMARILYERGKVKGRKRDRG